MDHLRTGNSASKTQHIPCKAIAFAIPEALGTTGGQQGTGPCVRTCSSASSSRTPRAYANTKRRWRSARWRLRIIHAYRCEYAPRCVRDPVNLAFSTNTIQNGFCRHSDFSSVARISGDPEECLFEVTASVGAAEYGAALITIPHPANVASRSADVMPERDRHYPLFSPSYRREAFAVSDIHLQILQ